MAIAGRLRLEAQLVKSHANSWSGPMQTAGQVSAITQLSQLSIWWLRLGIIPERIEPGRPDQNGRHERMHRTLKSTLPQPPAIAWEAQQKHFDRFMQHYNYERGHEALGQKTPASCYVPSTRAYPQKLPEMAYASHVECYLADFSGIINRSGLRIYVGHLLRHQTIGMEMIGDDVWAIIFGR